MRSCILLSAVVAALTCVPSGNAVQAEEKPQVVVLKLDDVVEYSHKAPRWLRVTDFLEKQDIKASYGIIGYSLEEDNPELFEWIKSLHDSGRIEFWNHGYRRRQGSDPTGEFEEGYEVQKESLEKTQRLAKEKLGLNLTTFGPHWSGTNADTTRALDEIPEITMWFYGPEDSSKFVFPRYLTLENPTHVPDFAKFKATYDSVASDKPCLALQGHPNSWDDQRWDNFVQIIEFLKSKGCVFMTPSEYKATLSKEQ